MLKQTGKYSTSPKTALYMGYTVRPARQTGHLLRRSRPYYPESVRVTLFCETFA